MVSDLEASIVSVEKIDEYVQVSVIPMLGLLKLWKGINKVWLLSKFLLMKKQKSNLICKSSVYR